MHALSKHFENRQFHIHTITVKYSSSCVIWCVIQKMYIILLVSENSMVTLCKICITQSWKDQDHCGFLYIHILTQEMASIRNNLNQSNWVPYENSIHWMSGFIQIF